MTPPGDELVIRPYGDHALLLECPDNDTHGWLAAIDALDDSRILESTPGATTILVRFASRRVSAHEVESALRQLSPLTVDARPGGEIVTIPVVYDGVDLDDIAAEIGMAVVDVVALHSAPTYAVGFVGFSPGFAYLEGLDPRLRVPRLDSPRPVVPAGSVAIADQWAGVYPRSSPGGWRLIGRTPMSIWDEHRTPPALLVPRTSVRFVPITSPEIGTEGPRDA